MIKYPPVPKILRSVPKNLSQMSDAQWDASVLWYSKLPLSDLRKRQGIVQFQREQFYRQSRASGKHPIGVDNSTWQSLGAMEEILTEAVMKKSFGNGKKNPFKRLTPYQESQLLSLYLDGQFQFKTDQGTRVPAKAFRAMMDALLKRGFIDPVHAKLTAAGKEYLDTIHNMIHEK